MCQALLFKTQLIPESRHRRLQTQPSSPRLAAGHTPRLCLLSFCPPPASPQGACSSPSPSPTAQLVPGGLCLTAHTSHGLSRPHSSSSHVPAWPRLREGLWAAPQHRPWAMRQRQQQPQTLSSDSCLVTTSKRQLRCYHRHARPRTHFQHRSNVVLEGLT